MGLPGCPDLLSRGQLGFYCLSCSMFVVVESVDPGGGGQVEPLVGALMAELCRRSFWCDE